MSTEQEPAQNEPVELPIACSLDAGSLIHRLAELKEIGGATLVSRNGRELRFRAGADTRSRLEAIAAAEAECCSFLDLSLREDESAGELVLTIDAPPEALPIADELAAAF